MNASDSQRIQELFHQAAELPAGERGDFLAAARVEDDALREDVLRLLKADEAAAESDAWQRPAIDHEARAQNAADLTNDEIVARTEFDPCPVWCRTRAKATSLAERAFGVADLGPPIARVASGSS
jgi:BMFP domain-containing protein YqiC